MATQATPPDLPPKNLERLVRTTALLVVASVLAVVLNEVVAVVARSSGASDSFAPLNLPVFGAFTVVGTLASWVGWQVVTRRASKPTSTLRVLVPLVVGVTFVPDVALLIARFIPDTSTIGVVALMCMHIVVVAIAIPTYILASRGPCPTR